MHNLISLIILFPLAGLLVNVIAGRKIGDPWAGIIASLASGASFVIAVLQFVGLAANGFEAQTVKVADWIVIEGGGIAPSLNVPWAFQIDTLSVTMMLLVTGVGTLIHVYAIGYMKGDERFHRFFIYLNLFIAAMLVLVGGDNYLMLFVGWEGVGLCSYLLIGFWFDQGGGGVGNARAGRKAFVVNRIGDFGFALAMFLIFWTTGSLTFNEVFRFFEEHAAAAQISAIATGITLLLLVGAAGKSAQLPLFVWLPDAMAGPTPVSALIHAATMVTAGIYMIARSNAIFHLAPASQAIVALVGAATAFLAGTIAVGQFDIKRVLAYSTISQLGFMIAAVGLGAYVAGMFHLITHAFFKALLFLSSGSVIHGLEHGHHALAHEGYGGGGHDNQSRTGSAPLTSTPPHSHAPPREFDPQDMRNMGGLRKHMRATFWVYLVGAAALAGVFPFAGFWSKDEILADAFRLGAAEGQWQGMAVYWLLTAAAFFTAFYMGRQIFMVFFGGERTEAARHARESSMVMLVPLVILAALSFVGGGLNLPGLEWLAGWLEHTIEAHAGKFNLGVALTSTVVALAAIALSYLVYGLRPMTTMTDPLQKALGPVFGVLHRKWFVDELYDWIIVKPFEALSRLFAFVVDWNIWHDKFHDTVLAGGFRALAIFTSSFVDKKVVDRFFDGLARFVQSRAGELRRLQSGYVRNYALAVLFGVLAILSLFLFVR